MRTIPSRPRLSGALAGVLIGALVAPMLPVTALAQPKPAAAKPGKSKTIREELPPAVHAKWDTAVVLYGAANWSAARTEFMDVYRETKNPRVLFNVAVCDKNTGHYARAIEVLKQELSEGAGKLSPEEETRAKETAAGLEAFVVELVVSVSEPGAKIYVDDVEVGVSPLASPLRVDIGERRLAAKKAGYADASTVKSFPQGKKPDPIELKLEAIAKLGTITVQVSGAPNATVRIDGKEVGASPYTGKLVIRSEPYVVEADAPGFATAKQSVVMKEGEAAAVSLGLSKEQRQGKLIVTTKPEGATILIDGKVVGSTRFEGAVDAGPHLVTAKKNGFYTYNLDVEVPKGGERPVTAILNEDKAPSFGPWLIGTVVVIGVGIGAAAVLFAPKDQDPYRGTLPPYIVEHQ
ncbi:MAG: PEGA domain-containing protein [Myxococcales bacterium]|nr:PEGA domain-containing protein [Myxococcales bacterium]